MGTSKSELSNIILSSANDGFNVYKNVNSNDNVRLNIHCKFRIDKGKYIDFAQIAVNGNGHNVLILPLTLAGGYVTPEQVNFLFTEFVRSYHVTVGLFREKFVKGRRFRTQFNSYQYRQKVMNLVRNSEKNERDSGVYLTSVTICQNRSVKISTLFAFRQIVNLDNEFKQFKPYFEQYIQGFEFGKVDNEARLINGLYINKKKKKDLIEHLADHHVHDNHKKNFKKLGDQNKKEKKTRGMNHTVILETSVGSSDNVVSKRMLIKKFVNTNSIMIVGKINHVGGVEWREAKVRKQFYQIECGDIGNKTGLMASSVYLCRSCTEMVYSDHNYSRSVYEKKNDELFIDGGYSSNYPYKSLMSLVRCKINYCERVGLDYGVSAFDNPLCFVMYWFDVLLSENSHTEYLLRVMRELRQMITIYPVILEFIDDIMRELLSEVDEYGFSNMFGRNQLAVKCGLWFGLKNVGGPKRPNATKVKQSIESWVSLKPDITCFEKEKMNVWLAEWVYSMTSNVMTFKEYQTDPLRWATSGGAPRVELKIPGNERFEWRSKWAYAISKLSMSSEVYENAKAEGNRASVALKEEAKTRTVITTPMASYLRQSYVMYLLGKPNFLNSTMANRQTFNEIRFLPNSTYLCIDASRFDHSVSKQFMIYFWKTLSGLFKMINMDEASALCLEEADSLLTLEIHYGQDVIPYDGGLLSGWRVTTLIGSIKSQLLCELINERLRTQFKYAVQGDDIMMVVDEVIDISLIKHLALELNIITNDEKTTSSGVGEFLKVQYDGYKATSYPVRSVRSIFYANPWLDSHIVKTPDQVASSWHGFFSRLMMMSEKLVRPETYYADFVENLFGWLGGSIQRDKIGKLLLTPISIGGLACSEFYHGGTENYIYEQVIEKQSGGEKWLLAFFGIEVDKVESKRFIVKKIDLNTLRSLRQVSMRRGFANAKPHSANDSNIFKTSLGIVLRKLQSALFTKVYSNCIGETDDWVNDMDNFPKYLRYNGNWKQLFSYYTNPTSISLPTSYFTKIDDDGLFKKQLSLTIELILQNTYHKTKILDISIRLFIHDRWMMRIQHLYSL